MNAIGILLFAVGVAWVMYRFGYNLKHWQTVRKWAAKQKEMAKRVQAYFQQEPSDIHYDTWSKLNNDIFVEFSELIRASKNIEDDWKAVWSKSAIYRIKDQYDTMVNDFIRKSDQNIHVYSARRTS